MDTGAAGLSYNLTRFIGIDSQIELFRRAWMALAIIALTDGQCEPFHLTAAFFRDIRVEKVTNNIYEYDKS
jgi:hypothetical protein